MKYLMGDRLILKERRSEDREEDKTIKAQRNIIFKAKRLEDALYKLKQEHVHKTRKHRG
jgi:hypothetical protein